MQLARIGLDGARVEPRANDLLSRVLPSEREVLGRRLGRLTLSPGDLLGAGGRAIEEVYFPVSGLIAAVAETDTGDPIEVATIGREGMAGLPLFFADDTWHSSMRPVIACEAYGMSAADFVEALARSPELARAVLGYAGAYLAIVAQTAACNHSHRLAKRLVRLLLVCADAAVGDGFVLTQDTIAGVLGTQRPTVSLAAEALARDGIIAYHRGRMRVLDRRGLEAASCECYATNRSMFDRLAA